MLFLASTFLFALLSSSATPTLSSYIDSAINLGSEVDRVLTAANLNDFIAEGESVFASEVEEVMETSREYSELIGKTPLSDVSIEDETESFPFFSKIVMFQGYIKLLNRAVDAAEAALDRKKATVFEAKADTHSKTATAATTGTEEFHVAAKKYADLVFEYKIEVEQFNKLENKVEAANLLLLKYLRAQLLKGHNETIDSFI
jgi:hypothetical protein